MPDITQKIRIPANISEQVRILAKAENRTIANMINCLIERGLNHSTTSFTYLKIKEKKKEVAQIPIVHGEML